MARWMRVLALLLTMVSLNGAAARAHAQPRASTRGATTPTERGLASAARAVARGASEAARRRLRPLLVRGSKQTSEASQRAATDGRVARLYLSLSLPLDAAPQLSLRTLATRQQRAREVLAQLARVTLTPDEDEDARIAALHVAWAAALVGRYDESLAAVQSAGRLQDPTTLACLRQIAAAAAASDQLGVAIDALQRARQYVPQDVDTIGELARVLLAGGQAHEAVSLLTERLAVTPDDLHARRDLAYALAAAGRAAEGLSLLAYVASDCAAAAGCTLEAARLALEAGQPDAAAHFAAQQLARMPDDLEALYVQADADAERGRFAEARATWQQVLRVRPDSARAKQALAQLPP